MHGSGGSGNQVTGLAAENNVVPFKCVDRIHITNFWCDGFNAAEDADVAVVIECVQFAVKEGQTAIAQHDIVSVSCVDGVTGRTTDHNVVTIRRGECVITTCVRIDGGDVNGSVIHQVGENSSIVSQ